MVQDFRQAEIRRAIATQREVRAEVLVELRKEFHQAEVQAEVLAEAREEVPAELRAKREGRSPQ